MTMNITHDNYYSKEANQAYFTASQIKTFLQCPSRWLAERSGQYERKQTDALFHGSYIDCALTEPDKFDQFCMDNASKVMTGKKKRSAIQTIDKAIARVKRDEYFMYMLSGDTQEVIVIEDFYGHPYKCMLDCLNFEDGFITDLKSCRDVNGEEWTRLEDGGFAKVHWIAFWRYPLQLALYREAVFQKYGGRLDVYIAAMEKKEVPNYDVFRLDDEHGSKPLLGELERAVEAMNQMASIKDHEPQAVRKCGHCEWCLMNKRIKEYKPFQYDPRLMNF